MRGQDPEGTVAGPTVGLEVWWTRLKHLQAKEPSFGRLLDARLRAARFAN